MNKITNNKKGAKMRKFILPILVAGAIAFTASQTMAALSNNSSFNEDTSSNNHYKKTDVVESGAGDFQISSGILGGFAWDGDTSYGYVTGENPFVAGLAGEPLGATDYALPAPLYTQPCPDWVVSGGVCPAQTNPLSPQTDDPQDVWDGTVMDDLYNVVGVNNGDWTSGGVDINGSYIDEHGDRKILDQTLDALFYNGKRGTYTYVSGLTTYSNDGITGTTKVVPTYLPFGTITAVNTSSARRFNIDQTLDQDLADYEVSRTGEKEIMGIFGKYTQNFQIAGNELTKDDMLAVLGPGWSASTSYEDGCASWGGSLNGESITNAEKTNDCVVWNSTNDSLGGTTWYDEQASNPFAAVLIEQWMVSEMYDFKLNSGDSKVQGLGTKQEYSSFFRDGSGKDFSYTQNMKGGHKEPTVSVTLPDHGSMDP